MRTTLPVSRLLLSLVTLSSGLLLTGQAHAHHAMGGRMPATFLEGLFSGLAHPVIGPDHVLTMIGVGLLSLLVSRGWLLGGLFVAFSPLGACVHLMRVTVPFAEPAVALSVVVFGALLLARAPQRGLWLPACAAIVGGLLHGYAYGESIVGAEASPLGAYFLGFTAIQLAILALVRTAGGAALRRGGDAAASLRGLRLCGGAIACVGLALFVFAARAAAAAM